MTRLTSYAHDGLTFDVHDSGPLDGPVVVLLHGFPQRASSWAQVTARLNDAGVRTVAPDQRGYSPGARPAGRRAYRVSRLIGDAAALVDALGGEPVHLVGHDWGAVVAWGLAAQHAERVASLVAVSVPHPAAFVSSMVRSDQLARSWYMAFFQLPWLPEALIRRRHHDALTRGGMTEEMADRFRADFVDDGHLTAPLNWYRALAFASPREVRRKVTVPTTMVWSEGDFALGRTGVELTERWVRAPYELRILEGVSHWIPEEAPDALAGAILARVTRHGWGS